MYAFTSITDYVWKALLAEFVGTFILVLVGASAVAVAFSTGRGNKDADSSSVLVALAFGLVFIGLFYTIGQYSGAHLNPAVSFGFALAGRMNWLLMLGYWVAQIVGGIAAGALVAYFFGNKKGNFGTSQGTLTFTDQWKAVLVEAILTFILVAVFLFVTGNFMLSLVGGVAIGLVLAACILAGYTLTGASLNPARTLGPAIFANDLSAYWIYVAGPLFGAFIAAIVYRLMTYNYTCCIKKDECGNVVTNKCGKPIKECERQVFDACGNPVKDCNGNNVFKKYTKIDWVPGHMQENYLTAAAGYLTAAGVDPRYVMDKAEKIGNKILNNENPIQALDKVIDGTEKLMDQAINSPAIENLVDRGLARASELLGSSSAATAATAPTMGLPTAASSFATNAFVPQSPLATNAFASQSPLANASRFASPFGQNTVGSFAAPQSLSPAAQAVNNSRTAVLSMVN